MKRRTVVTGAVALAASAVVPVGIGKALPQQPSAEAYEFAMLVMSLSPEKQAVFADQCRALPGPVCAELGDVVEGIAARRGWVRGEEHEALVRAFS